MIVPLATRTNARATAVARQAIVATEEGGIGDVILQTRHQRNTSIVPKLRDVHRMTQCPSGLFRWRLLVFPNRILNLIKVLRLSEVSRNWLFPRPG